MINRVASFLLLLGAWLSWSGHFTYDFHHPLVAIFGGLSCVGVLLLIIRFDQVAGDKDPYLLSWRPLTFIPWLLWEILKSNLHVAKVVMSPKMPISPRLIRVKATQRSELGRVIYANSITLTPGTITLDVRGDEFLVHALTDDTAEGVKAGEMDRKVTALEGAP